MNDLTLMLWLSDVVPSGADLLSIFGVLSLVSFVIFGIISFIATIEGADENSTKMARKISMVCAVFGFVFSFASCLAPSKDTINLMIASEVGEAVFTSDPAKQLGNKTLDAANKLLDSYLKEKSNAP